MKGEWMLVFVKYAASSYLLGYKETVPILWRCAWSPGPSPAPSHLIMLVGFGFLSSQTPASHSSHFSHAWLFDPYTLPVPKSRLLAFPEFARPPTAPSS